MPRSDEAEAFFWGVYAAVQEIPHGRVTTYGHIAALIGTRICLKHLPATPAPESTATRYHNANVPWQRVINAKGIISPRSQPGGAQNQAEALRAEGVVVVANAMGELSVDFEEYGWFPEVLPSEEAEEAVTAEES